MSIEDALRIAYEKGLDLIEVGPNARPPVCRIADIGKWKYEQAKRTRIQRREHKTVKSEVKGVRITFRASPHDLGLRAAQADTFLNEGHTVHIEMALRGREKGKVWFAKERMQNFLKMLTIPWRIQRDVHQGGRGLEMIIVRDKTKQPRKTNSESPIANSPEENEIA